MHYSNCPAASLSVVFGGRMRDIPVSHVESNKKAFYLSVERKPRRARRQCFNSLHKSKVWPTIEDKLCRQKSVAFPRSVTKFSFPTMVGLFYFYMQYIAKALFGWLNRVLSYCSSFPKTIQFNFVSFFFPTALQIVFRSFFLNLPISPFLPTNASVYTI